MREQGICLVNSDDSYQDAFDALPAEMRALLRESRFNICPACIRDVLSMTGRRPSLFPRIVAEFEIEIERFYTTGEAADAHSIARRIMDYSSASALEAISGLDTIRLAARRF